jgi:hypothetical protein
MACIRILVGRNTAAVLGAHTAAAGEGIGGTEGGAEWGIAAEGNLVLWARERTCPDSHSRQS